MKRLALAGFLATLGVAAIPAVAVAQNVDAGCPRAYYQGEHGCIPNTQGVIAPEYGNVDNGPRVYREAPVIVERPRYHHPRHYYVSPDEE